MPKNKVEETDVAPVKAKVAPVTGLGNVLGKRPNTAVGKPGQPKI